MNRHAGCLYYIMPPADGIAPGNHPRLANALAAGSISAREAAIVYPTLHTSAKDQVILIREPFAGVVQAEVILRPVNLLVLEEKLRDQSTAGRKAREDMARGLAFGC